MYSRLEAMCKQMQNKLQNVFVFYEKLMIRWLYMCEQKLEQLSEILRPNCRVVSKKKFCYRQ